MWKFVVLHLCTLDETHGLLYFVTSITYVEGVGLGDGGKLQRLAYIHYFAVKKCLQVHLREESKMETFDARLVVPYGMCCSGPPASGKTTFILKMIMGGERFMTRKIDYIVWFYGQRNATVEMIETHYKDRIQLVHGMPTNLDEYVDDREGLYGLHVYDDLMQSLQTTDKLVQLATTQVQHKRISWIFIFQDMFFRSTNRLTLLRCSHYQVIFNNPLDKTIAHLVARKIMPQNQKVFMKIFERATGRPHGYLFIDGRQTTPNCARLRTDILGYVQRTFVTKEYSAECKYIIDK